MHSKRSNHHGIRVRHSRSCGQTLSVTNRCSCKPSYEAQVWSPRDGKAIRKTFHTLSAARGWRADAQSAIRKGVLRAPTSQTLRDAAQAWVAGAKDGSIRNRSGDPYKPSAVRGYEQALELRILPELGNARLAAIGRSDLQDFADQLVAKGLNPSTVKNALMPLRAIYRRAVARGELAANPTTGLELPAVRGRRDRVASAAEASSLILALLPEDQALWATAFYGGLRRGELMALKWEYVHLSDGVMEVVASYDPRAKMIVLPKSKAGTRRVPIPRALREFLVVHRLRSGRSEGFVFGRTGSDPFDYNATVSRANRAWRAAELAPIGLHEARHTFASLMIAAGVNAKALAVYMGHSSVMVTLDRYGHLMPGNEGEAASLLETYLATAGEVPG